jgi:acyl-CoA synthetase (AMP-forming)/AMP-acid ligase II
VLERAVEALGPRLVQVYGQAEVSMTICVLPAHEHADPAAISGCSGYPFLFVDVALEHDGRRIEGTDEVGEVVVRSEHVMEGYWRNAEATAERLTADGGLRTQDLGRWDERGRLWLVGRSREMFISGGYNVFPGEIERRLGAVEGARAIAAFGVPHPRWGEATVVAVVPQGDGASSDELAATVERAARERLAAYERPKRVVVVDDLPLTAIGKVSRRDLASRFEGMFDA